MAYLTCSHPTGNGHAPSTRRSTSLREQESLDELVISRRDALSTDALGMADEAEGAASQATSKPLLERQPDSDTDVREDPASLPSSSHGPTAGKGRTARVSRCVHMFNAAAE